MIFASKSPLSLPLSLSVVYANDRFETLPLFIGSFKYIIWFCLHWMFEMYCRRSIHSCCMWVSLLWHYSPFKYRTPIWSMESSSDLVYDWSPLQSAGDCLLSDVIKISFHVKRRLIGIYVQLSELIENNCGIVQVLAEDTWQLEIFWVLYLFLMLRNSK